MEEMSYNISAGTYPTETADIERHRFVNERRDAGKSTYILKLKKKMRTAMTDVVEWYVSQLKSKINVRYYDASTAVVENSNSFIYLYRHEFEFTVYICGEKEFTEDIKDKASKHFTGMEVATINWYYSGPRGMQSHCLVLDNVKETKNEFYPYINGGLTNFYDRYRASESSILLMLGEPGTGKTSFIRNYIDKYKVNTILSYDETVTHSDEFFLNYLSEDSSNLLVIEDADLLLSSREDHGNRLMSKLLNVSDGLVKIVNKKIIFTTNITQMSRIDEALTRPGRCFEVLNFRKLTFSEACAAAVCVNREPPTENRAYTLAELFNQPVNVPKKSYGFTR